MQIYKELEDILMVLFEHTYIVSNAALRRSDGISPQLLSSSLLNIKEIITLCKTLHGKLMIL